MPFGTDAVLQMIGGDGLRVVRFDFWAIDMEGTQQSRINNSRSFTSCRI